MGPAFEADELFDQDYLHFFADPLEEAAESQSQLIWRLLGLQPVARVLDLACGHGRISSRLAGLGAEVTGLDRTPLFLERAREAAAERRLAIEYVEGDMRSLPWPQES